MNDLIPATSPLLRPSDRHRNSTDSFSLTSIRNDDIPEDLEFLAPGHWSDSEREFDETEDDSDDDDSIEDFSLEDGHIAGVPSCSSVFNAKQYHSSEFRASLLELLRDDLRVLGWSNLPADLPASLIKIHKVSGSLTNAVFFVSIPAAEFEINAEGAATPLVDSGRPATVLSELERGRGTATPKPDHAELPALNPGQKITIEAPTLLLRIYGPSSGALISRRNELHILHTLSATYSIGPRVLGTFANGRVEEYFHSRALHKEEMRDARISRWIGRRMRELHRVELAQMIPPDDGNKSRESSRSRSSSASDGGSERPSLENMGAGSRNGGSGASIYSTSSGSSIFSFGTSYSASSQGSWSSARGGSVDFGTTPMVESPLMIPHRYPSESRAESKKRSRYSLGRGRRSKDKLSVWENITRWTREAKLVLKQLDTLAQTPGYEELLASSAATVDAAPDSAEHVLPLASLARTLELRAQVNLPLFEQQIKLYRSFVRDWERAEGKSKRVFSHNDTQYGNLLLLTPSDKTQEQDLERQLQAPHQKIIVVDFEYSGPNPRGFDIANHFIEWQADYHHSSLSHSLADHDPYPTASERTRFLRAYVGCDGGLDTSEPNPSTTEDARVQRLEDEVKIWEPSSHAMWAVWGIVQAKEDLTTQVEKWKEACARKVAEKGGLEKGVEGIKLENGQEERPKLRRGKSGEFVDEEGKEVDAEKAEEEEVPVVDFDYLSYTLSRLTLFRQEVKKLGIIE